MVPNFIEKYICLIIGCQRSGTTLLRLILETHPQISVYEEPDCYDFLPNKILLQNEIIKKLMQWFKEEGISYVGALPKYDGSNLSYNLYMLTKMGSQGGLFILVGRKAVS